jgi:hypothetical protein
MATQHHPTRNFIANPNYRHRHTATRRPFIHSHQKAKLAQQSREKEIGIDCMMMTQVVDISFKKRQSTSIHGAPHRRPTIMGARTVSFSDEAKDGRWHRLRIEYPRDMRTVLVSARSIALRPVPVDVNQWLV